MRGDPARGHPDPDRGHLALIGPDPRLARNPEALQAVSPHDSDQNLLEIAQVPVDVPAVRTEIEDRVSDELPRTVVRDVPSPSRLRHLDSEIVSFLRSHEHVGRIGGRAHGDDVGMLQQQELVRHRAVAPALDEIFLKLRSVPIGHQAQPSQLDDPGVRRRGRVFLGWLIVGHLLARSGSPAATALAEPTRLRSRGSFPGGLRLRTDPQASSGNSSSISFRWERKRAASAPSTIL